QSEKFGLSGSQPESERAATNVNGRIRVVSLIRIIRIPACRHCLGRSAPVGRARPRLSSLQRPCRRWAPAFAGFFRGPGESENQLVLKGARFLDGAGGEGDAQGAAVFRVKR